MSDRTLRKRPAGTPPNPPAAPPKKARASASAQASASAGPVQPLDPNIPKRKQHDPIPTAKAQAKGLVLADDVADDSEREQFNTKSRTVTSSNATLARQQDVKHAVDNVAKKDNHLTSDQFDSRTAAERLVDAFLRQGPIVRQLRPRLDSYEGQINDAAMHYKIMRWRFAAIDDASKVHYLAFQPQTVCTATEAEWVCQELVEVAMRWPAGQLRGIVSPSDSAPGNATHMQKWVLPVIMNKLRGTQPPILANNPTYNVEKRNGRPFVRASVLVWDPVTFLPKTEPVKIRVEDVSEVDTVRDPPDDLINFAMPKRGENRPRTDYHGKDDIDANGQPCFPSIIPNDLDTATTKTFRNMESLGRMLVWKLSQRVISTKDLQVEILRLKQLYAHRDASECAPLDLKVYLPNTIRSCTACNR